MRMDGRLDAGHSGQLSFGQNCGYVLRGIFSGLILFSLVMRTSSMLAFTSSEPGSIVREGTPAPTPADWLISLVILSIGWIIYPGRYQAYAQKQWNRIAKDRATKNETDTTLVRPTQQNGPPSEPRTSARSSFCDRMCLTILLGMGVVIVVGIGGVVVVATSGQRFPDVLAHNKAGISYFKDDRYDEAVAAFTKASVLNPMKPQSYMNRALVYRKQGDWDQAILDYSKVINLMETRGAASGLALERVYYLRGVALHKRGNNDQAINDWAMAMRLRPYALKAYRQREHLLQRLGQTRQANTDLSLAVWSQPTTGDKAGSGRRSRSQTLSPKVDDLRRQALPAKERIEVHGETLTFEIPDRFSRLRNGAPEFTRIRKEVPPIAELLCLFIEDSDQGRLHQGKQPLLRRTISILTVAAPPVDHYTQEQFNLVANVGGRPGNQQRIKDFGRQLAQKVGWDLPARQAARGIQQQSIQSGAFRYRDDCFVQTGIVKVTSAHGKGGLQFSAFALAYCLRKGKIIQINVKSWSRQRPQPELEWATTMAKRCTHQLN